MVPHKAEGVKRELELDVRSFDEIEKDLVVDGVSIDISSTSTPIRYVMKLGMRFVTWLSRHDSSPLWAMNWIGGSYEDHRNNGL